MAAKIFAFVALLALSVSAATAYISPLSVASATIIPQYFPQTSIAAIHPCVRYYTQLQAFASGISAPSSILIQQPLAILQQQCQAHLAIQSIVTQQQQQQLLLNPIATLLPNLFNQLALANPITAAYWQQQQLFPNVFNQLALSNVLNQLALVSPNAYWQQQQLLSNVFNQVPNVFNQLALVSPNAYWQQQQLLSNVFNQVPNVFNQLAQVSPNVYRQQQQLLSNVFNQVTLANPAAYLQQPFIGGAIF